MLLAHLFVAITNSQAMQRFHINPSKNRTIAALMDASFLPIKATDNIKTPYVTPRTIAYVHALIVDSISLHHADALNELAIENEDMVLGVRNEVSPDAFREELFQVLSKYHVEIIKTAGASGRIAHKTFRCSVGSAAVSAQDAGVAGGDAPNADPPAAPAARPRPRRPLGPRRPPLISRPLLEGERAENRERDDLNECFD